MYRLLALDLDGTLVDADLRISPRNRAALAAAQARGIHVTIATGRMFRAAQPFAQSLGLTTPLICYQGAMIVDPVSLTRLYHQPVPLALAREVLQLARERAWHAHVYVDDAMYVDEITPQVAMYTALSTTVVAHPVGDLLAFLQRDPTKLLMIAGEAETLRTVDELSRRFADRLYVTQSYPYFAEVAHPACSKGNALAWLARHLGIAQAETMAIGDALNDREMVAWAGLGVAMGNAVPQVKAAAGYVTGPVDQDGVAGAVERYLL